MNWLSGWLREQFDFPVNLVRGLVPVEAPTLSFEHGSGAKVEFSGSGGKRYRGVAKFYMGDDELFRDFKKGTVELHNENWSYAIGRTKVFFIDVLSGSPVMLDGGTAVTFSPAVLKELFGVAHLRGAAKAVLAGLGGDWLKYAIGILLSDDGGMPPMEAGTVVDVLKKLAKGSLVLSNNRNPKAYALVYCYSDCAPVVLDCWVFLFHLSNVFCILVIRSIFWLVESVCGCSSCVGLLGVSVSSSSCLQERFYVLASLLEYF